MHIDMARQTVGEHFQLTLVVRLTMTFQTARQFAMCLVTNDTTNLTVLARRTLPLTINFIMTTAAGLDLDITREVNS